MATHILCLSGVQLHYHDYEGSTLTKYQDTLLHHYLNYHVLLGSFGLELHLSTFIVLKEVDSSHKQNIKLPKLKLAGRDDIFYSTRYFFPMR